MEDTFNTLRHGDLLENLQWVPALARRLVGESTADDVEQDVWVKALERPPRARAGPELRAWLAQVTRTLARQDARSRERRSRRERSVARPEDVPSTYDVVARGEAQRMVAESVMNLEEPARSTVLLRYLDGLSAVEIAKRRGESPAAVRKRLSRALETLRERLEERLGGRNELLGALVPLLSRGGGSTKTALAAKYLAPGLALVIVASICTWFGVRAWTSAPAKTGAVEARASAQQALGSGAADPVIVAGDARPSGASAAHIDDPTRPAAAGAQPGGPPRAEVGALLAAVPEAAFALLHLGDPSAFRSRAEDNDWVALYASPRGESALSALTREYETGTGTEFDGLLEVALELHGEALLFFTGQVAGFLTEPPPDRAALATVLDGWLAAEARRTIEIEGGQVQLAAWPSAPHGGAERAGHFLAFFDHPLALGLYSGDSADAVLDALRDSLGALRSERRARVVEGFLAAGGGTTRGIEAFVDFTPFVAEAERTLRDAVEGVLPDPTGLLGLELGTWLFVTADVSPGTRVEVQGRLAIPEETLAAELADCFQPLAPTLPADLPRGTWSVAALDWDLSRFIATARAGLERAHEDGLAVVDQRLADVETLSGVDPIQDVIEQLTGLFALYHVLDQGRLPASVEDGFGLLVGLVDEERFLEAFETLLGVGGIGVDPIELENAEAYLLGPDRIGSDGGLAFLPQRLAASPSRSTLVRSLRALGRVEDAALPWGSELQGALDENAGAFAFAYAELTYLRGLWLSEEVRPVGLERDPFDSQIVFNARRTVGGFEGRIYSR